MRTLILFAIASLIIGGFMTHEVARWCAAEHDRPGRTEPAVDASTDTDNDRLGLQMAMFFDAGLPLPSHRYIADVNVDLADLDQPGDATASRVELIPLGFAVNTAVYGALLFAGVLAIMRLTGGKRRGGA